MNNQGGRNQGHRNAQGQNRRNNQGQGQQRGQGPNQMRQNNPGGRNYPDQGQQSYHFQGEPGNYGHQYYQEQGPQNFYGQDQNYFGQGQYGAQGHYGGQPDGLLPNPQQPMRYPGMMQAPPYRPPPMMQPYHQMPPHPLRHPQSLPPPPFIPEWDNSNIKSQTQNRQGLRRPDPDGGHPQRGYPNRRARGGCQDIGYMERSSSTMSMESIGSQPDQRVSNNRGRGGRGRGGNQRRGNMERSSSTMSIESIGSQPDQRVSNNRGRGGRGRGGNQRRGNMERSSSTMSIESIGSQPDQRVPNNQGRGGRGRGSNQRRGNMERSSSTMSIESIGSQPDQRVPNNRGRGGRGRGGNQRRGNMERSSSTMSMESIGSQPDQRVPNNQGRGGRGRGGGRGGNLRGRGGNHRRGGLERSSSTRSTDSNGSQSDPRVQNNRDCGYRQPIGNMGKNLGDLGAKPKKPRNMAGASTGNREANEFEKKNIGNENRSNDRRRGGNGRGRGGRNYSRSNRSRGRARMRTCDNLNNPDEGSNTSASHTDHLKFIRQFRGRDRFNGRGRSFRGRWSGFVGSRRQRECDDDNNSTVAQIDSDDDLSEVSDATLDTSSVTDDVEVLSDRGSKDEINFEDLKTVGTQTLKNREKRYRRKMRDMEKKKEDANEIKKYRDAISKFQEEINRRRALEVADQRKKRMQNKEKEREEAKKKHKSETDDGNESEDSDSEVKTKHHIKAKRKPMVLAVKGRPTFNPKKLKRLGGKPSQTKVTQASSNTDTDQDQMVEEKKDVEKRKRNRNRKKKPPVASDDITLPNSVKPSCETENENEKLTAILSQLDGIGRSEIQRSPLKVDTFNSPSNISPASKSRTNSLNETSQSNIQGPDVNEVFKFMVRTLEGKGTPEEVKRESGLFPVDFDEMSFFCKLKSRFTVIERNGTIEFVFVLNRDATYCLDYITTRSCGNENCRRYHICKDYISGNCVFGEGCKFSHDFLDDRNLPVSKRLGYSTVFTNEEICSILRVRYPHICSNLIDNGTCEVNSCVCLHLCPRYMRGKCLEGVDCPLSHDRESDHNKPIVEAYKMCRFAESIFKKMIYMVRQSGVDKAEPVVNKPEPANNRQTEELVEAIEVARHVPKRRERRESNTTPSDRMEEMEESASAKYICEKNLTDNCRRRSCKYLHSQASLPYIWQVYLYDTWVNLEDFSIETAFSNNQDYIEGIEFVYQNMRFHGRIVFELPFRAKFLIQETGERINTKVRRLSTMSYKESNDNSGTFKTQWRWYWMDDAGSWLLFEPDPMQHTLEAKFLAKQKDYNYSRENYRFKYVIDFNKMEQLNIDTKKRRKINRRPIFVSALSVRERLYPQALSPAPVIETPLPDSWHPWDVASPFELVKIDPSQPKYTEVSDSFFKTLDRSTIEIDSIFRMQNHKLWSLYCNQERIMETNIRRLGGEASIDKRYLFHGTDSLDAVRGISINNLDARVSGKNATVYGDGAYFARKAKYSHSYTKGPTRFMFMATVLVGQFTVGHKSYRRPPTKPGNDHELYDSCVDRIPNPSIFIVFDKNQYYPEFLIQYHKLYEDDSYQQVYTAPTPTVRSIPQPASYVMQAAGGAGSSSSARPSAARSTSRARSPTTVHPTNLSYSSPSSSPYSNPASPTRTYPTSSRAYTSGSNTTTASPPNPPNPPKKNDNTCCIQ